MLIKPSADQLQILASKLERRGLNSNHGQSGPAYHRLFYQSLSDLGFSDSRNPGPRALAPDWEALGMTRVGGAPTVEEQELFEQVTSGGDLEDDGYVCQVLLFDNDLLTDRYSAGTFQLLCDLYSKYLGRSNDFNHEFNVTQSRARIIQLGIGADDSVALHPDTPRAALGRLSPANPYAGIYTALWATLAFPHLENDPSQVVERIQKGLIRDVSVAFSSTPGAVYCSVCLAPMATFWFWNYCEEHGFPGGSLEAGGEKVVAILDGAADAMTFGLVSDGAVKRAGIVIDPRSEQTRATATTASTFGTFHYVLSPLSTNLVEMAPVTASANSTLAVNPKE